MVALVTTLTVLVGMMLMRFPEKILPVSLCEIISSTRINISSAALTSVIRLRIPALSRLVKTTSIWYRSFVEVLPQSLVSRYYSANKTFHLNSSTDFHLSSNERA